MTYLIEMELAMTIAPADYILHIANILLLVAYSVRSILWLRCFAVAASAIAIPYYFLQDIILWPPVLWSLVFIAINLFQIFVILWERRPVVLSADEQTLYDLEFKALPPRDFVSLVMVGEWRTADAGEKLLSEGMPSGSISVPIWGSVEIRRQGRRIGKIQPGQMVGTAVALLGEPSPIDAVFVQPARYIHWPLSHIRIFLNKKPELRAVLEHQTSHELARKVQQLIDGAAVQPGELEQKHTPGS